MPMKSLGIAGGMGSEATVQMFSQVIRWTAANCDQDHLEIIIHNNNRVPDRTKAILGIGESPIPELMRSVSKLEMCGVDLIIIPCITSHYFLDKIQEKSRVPILDAVHEVVQSIIISKHIKQKVGVLATTGTIQSRLFQDQLEMAGYECVLPNNSDQENLIMNAIYGQAGIKAGHTKGVAKTKLHAAADTLKASGAEAIIAGCTEIPLVLDNTNYDLEILDPMKILAVKSIEYCGGKILQQAAPPEDTTESEA